ncbi:Acid beta-fructofuranosidase 1, vacuolar, partial [Linum perenne]
MASRPDPNAPLLDPTRPETKTQCRRRRRVLISLLVMVGLLALTGYLSQRPAVVVVERGVKEGVSAKSSLAAAREVSSYNWTNAMLTWQRTAYHFQPERNWMNDPNGTYQFVLFFLELCFFCQKHWWSPKF